MDSAAGLFDVVLLLVFVAIMTAIVRVSVESEQHRIPNQALLVGMLVATVAAAIDGGEALRMSLASLVGCMMGMAVITNIHGMPTGMGGLKLAGMTGSFIGPAAFAGVFITMLLVVLKFVLTWFARKLRPDRRRDDTRIAVAPLLALGSIAAVALNYGADGYFTVLGY